MREYEQGIFHVVSDVKQVILLPQLIRDFFTHVINVLAKSNRTRRSIKYCRLILSLVGDDREIVRKVLRTKEVYERVH